APGLTRWTAFALCCRALTRAASRRTPRFLVGRVLGRLGAARAIAALDDSEESAQFVAPHLAMLSQRQVAELDGTEGDPLQLHDFVADTREQSAQLAIVSFGQHQFDQRALAADLDDIRLLHPELPFRKVQAALELSQRFSGRYPGHQQLVRPH